jgi:hypothetical protein
MAVASNQINWVWFDVPSDQETGLSKLQIVANGVASQPVFINVRYRERED